MKRILSLIFTLSVSFTLFSAEGEYTSGNVVIARKDELPGGLFVKAAGYLPGDSVVLSNPETGESLSLLNLGTLDASEGTALLVSQEAAAKLGLDSSSVMSVKLTGRSGTIDKSSTGSAVLEKNAVRNIPHENAVEPEIEEVSYADDEQNAEDDFISVKNAVEQPSPAEEIEDSLSDVQEENSDNVSEPDDENTDGEKSGEIEAETTDGEKSDETEAETTVEESFEEDIVEEQFEEEIPEIEETVPEESSAVTEEELPVDEADETSSEDDHESVPEEIQEERFDAEELEPVSENIVETVPVEEEASEESVSEDTEGTIVPEEAFEVDELEPVEEPVSEILPAENEGIPENDLEGEFVDSEEPEISESEENISSLQPVEEDVFVDDLPEDLTEDNPDEPVADFAVEETEPSEEDIVIVPVEEDRIVPENTDVPENDLDGEEVASVEPALKTDVPENDGIPEDDLEGEAVENSEPESAEEPSGDEVPEIDLPGEEPVEEFFEDEPVPENDDEPEADFPGEIVEEDEPVLPVGAADEPEENYEGDSYEGIVLVPAESIIPDETSDFKPVEESISQEEAVPEISAGEDVIKRYAVNENELKKDSYYVQIAAVGVKENLEQIAEKYSKYPLVFVQTSKGAYRVMIGPLSVDEYGAVLARFKSFGYKDAFVRFIK